MPVFSWGHFVDTGQELLCIVGILLGNGQRQAVDIIYCAEPLQEWGSGGRWFGLAKELDFITSPYCGRGG
ncbi:MAG TPA: hypothetical protein VMC85_18275 [Desulfomonilaceae bacterium]|nr:hypothetical protein [Desulfomonilaceae bacterium]